MSKRTIIPYSNTKKEGHPIANNALKKRADYSTAKSAFGGNKNNPDSSLSAVK